MFFCGDLSSGGGRGCIATGGLYRVFRAFNLAVAGLFRKKIDKFLVDTIFGHSHQ